MKGIVFTEFIEHVESNFGHDLVDQLLEDPSLESEGVYTAVGIYDYKELVAHVTTLSQHVNIDTHTLIHSFGQYLFGRFLKLYPQLFEGIENAFDFLKRVEDYIHVEVRKLYSNPELPSFQYEQPEPHVLIMIYTSKRPFADLAEGLISACIEHYQENISIAREDLPHPDLYHSRFVLTSQNR